jgi:glycosyltransferase involved in cell wall biosynthesis
MNEQNIIKTDVVPAGAASGIAMTPLVSICIPTYNAEATIKEAIASIINQAYSNIHIHVMDNASTDDTLKIVAEFQDPRIRIHRNDINIGGEGNFNRCIQVATGKYTAIFHADDIYESNMVQTQVAFLELNPEAGAVFTEAKLIDNAGHEFGNIEFPAEFNSSAHLYDFEIIFKAILRHSNFLICPSVMARTDVYQQEIKGWRGDMFGSSADLDVWLRIAGRHPVGLIPMQLMRYRISSNQGSAQVRLQTVRADFFKVVDYNLSLAEVRVLLNQADLQNYARLERRDKVMCAINLFLAGRTGEVRPLLTDIYSKDALSAALQGKRGLGVLIAGILLKIFLLLRLNDSGKIIFSLVKRVMRK